MLFRSLLVFWATIASASADTATKTLLWVSVDDHPEIIYQLDAEMDSQSGQIHGLHYYSPMNPKFQKLDFAVSDLKNGIVIKKALKEAATTLIANRDDHKLDSLKGGELQVKIMREKSMFGASSYRELNVELINNDGDWKMVAVLPDRKVEFKKLNFRVWNSGDPDPNDLSPSVGSKISVPKGVKLIEFFDSENTNARMVDRINIVELDPMD
ncbi:MAG: hypothetical protein JNL01_02105 [Bdellovibrionales bacterium]|nr:hypothetical protein [Bdellovibrionales bacterium]